MEAIVALLNTYLADDATLRWFAIAVVAVIIFVFASGVSIILMGVTDPIRRKLGMINEAEPDKGTLSLKIMTAIGPVAAFVLPKEELERNKVKGDLYRAGFHSPQALQIFYALKAVLAIALAMITLLASRFMPNMDTQSIMMYVAVAAAVGLLAPNMFWRSR